MGKHLVLLDPRDPERVWVGPASAICVRPVEWDLLLALADGRLQSDARLYDKLFGERLPEPGALYSHASRIKRSCGPVLHRVAGRGLRLADQVQAVQPWALDVAGVIAAFEPGPEPA